MRTAAQLMIGMALLFAVLGVAGFALGSFSYPLALILAVLFGLAGVLGRFARTARQRWTLFGVATLIALSATYVWVVGGGAGLGGPPAIRASTPTGTPSVPGSCTKQTATKLVNEFFVKWNERDVGGVVGLFAANASFNDNVGGQKAMLSGHEALRRYLSDRFAAEDRFSGVTADIPENPSPARANPTVSFVRSVGATTYRGNAKLVCVDDLLRDLVMSSE